MYLIEIQEVDDDYKRRNDGFYTQLKKTKEEAIKYVNEIIYYKCNDYCLEVPEKDDVVNSTIIRSDLIKKHFQTEFTQEPYEIMYWIYELDENMEKKLILTNANDDDDN